MSWRVVVISRRCKLEYKLGYLVCRGEEMKKVHISEISSLIIESTAVSLTASLLCELVKRKINIVFCDEKHNPQSQLIALYGRHDASGVLQTQLEWREEAKRDVWTEIVRLKILHQYKFLHDLGLAQADLLKQYSEEILIGDTTNREGHSAKVYFNALFGMSFKRCDNTFINSALNYGYAVMLSAFNRELTACGCNTQIGLNHRNEFNHFNLSCDFIEPFRVIVDRYVFARGEEMTSDYKHELCNILNLTVKCDRENFSVSNAISVYCRSLLRALQTGDVSQIKCYEL